jgi:hypothetical protein
VSPVVKGLCPTIEETKEHKTNLECRIIFKLATMRQYVCGVTAGQRLTEINRQTAAFPLEYGFDFESLMRAILPISCSLLRSWTVLPSGL